MPEVRANGFISAKPLAVRRGRGGRGEEEEVVEEKEVVEGVDGGARVVRD